MLCSLDLLASVCLRPRARAPETARVALLIEDFPRPQHPSAEFAELLFLLREHGAKATFVVGWQGIRSRGLGTAVADMMRLLQHEGHEVAIRFSVDVCGASQLTQHVAEALHFLQRVYGITVVSAKLGGRMHCAGEAALRSLGVTVVDGIGTQRVVRDTADLLHDAEVELARMRGAPCVCVRDFACT